MSTYKVAVLVGSLRAQSITRKLAKALIARKPDTLDCEIVPIDMALYNEDLDANPPASWEAFREKVGQSDAVLFVSPEYNRSIPGALKNAIDVGSRPYGRGCLLGKPAGVVAQAPGPLGGSLANHAIRQAILFVDMKVLGQPEMYLPRTKDVFGDDGSVADDSTAALLTRFMTTFADWIVRFHPAS